MAKKRVPLRAPVAVKAPRGRRPIFERPTSMLVKLDERHLEAFRSAARRSGKTLSEWARQALLRAARESESQAAS